MMLHLAVTGANLAVDDHEAQARACFIDIEHELRMGGMKGAHRLQEVMLVARAAAETVAQALHEALARHVDIAEQHTLGVEHQRAVAIARDDGEALARLVVELLDQLFANDVRIVLVVASLAGEERQRAGGARAGCFERRRFVVVRRAPHPHRARLAETRRHADLDAAPIPGEIHAWRRRRCCCGESAIAPAILTPGRRRRASIVAVNRCASRWPCRAISPMLRRRAP
jgi:hypothetical protein